MDLIDEEELPPQEGDDDAEEDLGKLREQIARLQSQVLPVQALLQAGQQWLGGSASAESVQALLPAVRAHIGEHFADAEAEWLQEPVTRVEAGLAANEPREVTYSLLQLGQEFSVPATL